MTLDAKQRKNILPFGVFTAVYRRISNVELQSELGFIVGRMMAISS